MSQDKNLRRHALRQLCVLVSLLAAGGALLAWAERRPDGLDEIRITAGTLRSQSAELAWIADHAGGVLPPRFLRAHARQLDKAIDTTRDELAHLRPEAALRAVPATLEPHAQSLAIAVQAMQEPGAPASAARPQALHERTEALAAVELALQR